MSKLILITGVTGTIGSQLVNLLKLAGVDFKAMVRSEKAASELTHRGIKSVVADLGNVASLEKALEGVSKVFLLSPSSPQMPELQINLVQAAMLQGISHIVKISSRGSDLQADFNIGRWHGEIEESIRKSGIPFTFLRAHSFMQNLFFDADIIREKNTLFSSQGKGRIAMIDTRDIASVASCVLRQNGHEGKTYLLTGPSAVSYYDVASELSHLLKRPVKFTEQSQEEGYQAMKNSGMPGWLIDDMFLLNQRYARNEADEVSTDVERVTGKSAIPLRQFLHDHLDVFS